MTSKKQPPGTSRSNDPEDITDGFVARRSNHVSGAKFNQSDGDTWQETLAVCEVNNKLSIRSYFTNIRTNERVWGEPPSGAGTIKEASEEMRKMAKVQLNELQIVTGEVNDSTEAKKKGLLGGLFRRGSKITTQSEDSENKSARDGIKGHSRIQYKANSFIAEAKKKPKYNSNLDPAMQEALAESIAQSSGHLRKSAEGFDEEYSNRRVHFHSGNLQKSHSDDELELAMALSLSLGQPLERSAHRRHDSRIPPSHETERSAHGRAESKSPPHLAAERSAHGRDKSKSPPHRAADRSAHGRERSRSPHNYATELSAHGRDQRKSPPQHVVERSAHGRQRVDSDLEKALVLSLAESIKPRSRLKEPTPGASRVTPDEYEATAGFAALPPTKNEQSVEKEYYRSMKHTHKGGSLHLRNREGSNHSSDHHHRMQRRRSLGDIPQSEGEAIAMAMALSLSTHTTEEEDNRKPAAKQYDGNKTTAINLQEPVASERDDNEGELDAMA